LNPSIGCVVPVAEKQPVPAATERYRKLTHQNFAGVPSDIGIAHLAGLVRAFYTGEQTATSEADVHSGRPKNGKLGAVWRSWLQEGTRRKS